MVLERSRFLLCFDHHEMAFIECADQRVSQDMASRLTAMKIPHHLKERKKRKLGVEESKG